MSDTTPRRAPTLLGFIALGLFWGAWASVLPSVQEATGASKGALGLALLFVTLGAIPAMLFIGGPTVERFGPRAVAVTCAAFAAVVDAARARRLAADADARARGDRRGVRRARRRHQRQRGAHRGATPARG